MTDSELLTAQKQGTRVYFDGMGFEFVSSGIIDTLQRMAVNVNGQGMYSVGFEGTLPQQCHGFMASAFHASRLDCLQSLVNEIMPDKEKWQSRRARDLRVALASELFAICGNSLTWTEHGKSQYRASTDLGCFSVYPGEMGVKVQLGGINIEQGLDAKTIEEGQIACEKHYALRLHWLASKSGYALVAKKPEKEWPSIGSPAWVIFDERAERGEVKQVSVSGCPYGSPEPEYKVFLPKYHHTTASCKREALYKTELDCWLAIRESVEQRANAILAQSADFAKKLEQIDVNIDHANTRA